MLQRLTTTPDATDVQETSFSIDVMGRYVCNTWDEATNNGGAPFDVVVVGAGMFGAYLAAKLHAEGEEDGAGPEKKLRILVLEAGPFLAPTHLQNLPRIGLGVPGPASDDPGHTRERVWGLPWHSPPNAPFTGLAYVVGGRSIFWGGWAPRMEPADLAAWPRELREHLLNAGYSQVEREIGLGDRPEDTEDYIGGPFQRDLEKAFRSVANGVPTVKRVERAPLAVQADSPRSGLFSFDKFSSATILVDAIRRDRRADHERRLFLVPRVHVTRLETRGSLVVGIHAHADGAPRYLPLAPGAKVVLANGTIEATRLALESFPTPLMGRNLMGHLRSNLVVRIKRDVLTAPNEDIATAALLVRGETPEGRYHLQVTAVDTLGKNSEEEMWHMVPDIDLRDRMANRRADWVVLTLRGIGEMRGTAAGAKTPDKSWMDLSPWRRDEHGMRRAWVNIVATPGEDKLWKTMEEASLELARKLAGSDANVEYLVHGEWVKHPPAPGATRDKLGTTHHEAGTLWIGADPNASVTDLDGRFHHVANAYVAGPAIFPTMGSANPALTALALARRTADRLGSETPAPLEAGFRPLSNDRWRMSGQGGFRSHRGILETFGGPGVLWNEEALGDFVLRLEYRQAGRYDNSGVFVRAPPLPPHDPAPAVHHGYEVQIDERGWNPDTSAEGDPLRVTGAVYGLSPATRRAARPFGRWNDLEIEARGDRITVTLNGEVVSKLDHGARNRTGHVGLQNHHEGSLVQFRNLRVKPL